jgi:hypothetical protein
MKNKCLLYALTILPVLLFILCTSIIMKQAVLPEFALRITSKGAAVPDLKIVLKDKNNALFQFRFEDDEMYHTTTIPEGTYSIIATKGKDTLIADSIRVSAGKPVVPIAIIEKGKYLIKDQMIPGRHHISSFQLVVEDKAGQSLTDLSVVLTSTSSEDSYTLAYDTTAIPAYRINNVVYGVYTLHIFSGNKELLSDVITLLQPRTDEKERSIHVTIGEPGDSYTYKNGIKYPYTPQPGMVGISFKKEHKEQVWKLCKKLGFTVPALNAFSGPSPPEDNNIYVIVSKKKALSSMNSPELKALRTSGFVVSAGPMIKTGKGTKQKNVILSTAIYVSYDAAYDSQMDAFFEKNKATKNPAGLDTYRITMSPEVGYGVLEIAARLNQMDSIVSYADPDL